MRLNGWLRLWIVFVGTLALTTATVAVMGRHDGSRPEETDRHLTLIRQSATNYQIENSGGEQFEVLLPNNITTPQIEEFVMASNPKTQKDFDDWAEITMKRAAAIQAAQARILNHQAREANRTFYILLTVLVVGLALGTYFIGATIAWIRAGFQ